MLIKADTDYMKETKSQLTNKLLKQVEIRARGREGWRGERFVRNFSERLA